MNKKFKPSKSTIEAALWACELLKDAYKMGKDNGGSVDWDDVDQAYKQAVAALFQARKEGYKNED